MSDNDDIPEYVRKAAEQWGGIKRKPEGPRIKSKSFCSFCGTSEDDVDVLIAGPMVFICDECVDTAVDIVAEHKQPSQRFPPLV
jgi:hypothetical protein